MLLILAAGNQTVLQPSTTNDLNMPTSQLEIKKHLLAEALRIQKQTVETARKAMQEAQESANDNEDDTEEKLFNSYREEMQNKRDLFAKQLEQAIDDLALLSKVNVQEAHNIAEFGSVVITDQQKLFVATSLGQLKLEQDSYFAISPSAPIYKAFKGLEAGTSFTFRDKSIKILEVF